MSTENIFLNLHVHSHYSARDSLIGIDDLVDLAKKNNEAVAICDHGSLHSWFEIDQKFSNAGLKPVYGVEAYVNRHRDRLFEIKQELKGLKDKERRANLNAEKRKIEISACLVEQMGSGHECRMILECGQPTHGADMTG